MKVIMNRNDPLIKWTTFLTVVVALLTCAALSGLSTAQEMPSDVTVPAVDTSGDAESVTDASAQTSTDDSTDSPTDTADPSSEANVPAAPAAAPVNSAPPGMPWYIALAAVLGTLVLPLIVGSTIAKRVRMPELAWKINLALITITTGAVICLSGDVKLGPDLSGGILLIYELEPSTDADENARGRDSDLLKKMIAAVRRRVEPLVRHSYDL